MKIAIVNDTHADLKNGSEVYMTYLNNFFGKVFFPYCEEHDITQVIHAGDYFDNRRGVSVKALYNIRKSFLEPMIDHKMEMTIIPGNHDVCYKNTNTISSLREMLGYYKSHVQIVSKPLVKKYDSLPIAFLPWVTEDNYAPSMSFIDSCQAPVLIAHLELAGFEMMKGMPAATHGMDAGLFKRFEMVLSGHYHTKSTKGNITYLGSQLEQTWADCDDPKYFHVLDTETRTLQAIRNPLTLYSKIIYNDTTTDPLKQDLSAVPGKFVKVIVAKKTSNQVFDRFMERVQDAGPIDQPKIVESFDEFMAASQDDEPNEDLEDTGKLLHSYIESVETDLDKEHLKNLIRELYVEAQAGDTQ